MRRLLFVGLAVFAGAAVTAFLWPAWYDIAPVIPLSERLARAAMAVAPGIVVTSVGLQLLAGLPLVSWFATWTGNLLTKGWVKSPVAAWRELRAAEEAARRWRERPLGPRIKQKATRVDRSDERLYADVERDHHEHGDEGPALYKARKSAANATKPLKAPGAAPKGSLSPDARHAFWRVFGRPPSEPSPPGAPRPDGVVLNPQASEALIRDVLKDDPQKPR